MRGIKIIPKNYIKRIKTARRAKQSETKLKKRAKKIKRSPAIRGGKQREREKRKTAKKRCRIEQNRAEQSANKAQKRAKGIGVDEAKY